MISLQLKYENIRCLRYFTQYGWVMRGFMRDQKLYDIAVIGGGINGAGIAADADAAF